MVTTIETDASWVWRPSEIQQYFAGKTVFITGGTGFLGKLIWEKLLRSCKDIEKIYVLIRPKKGKSEKKRFEEISENVLFDRLRKEQPNFAQKVSLITGDCIHPNLGLQDDDIEKLIEEVNCVFHCAATVRFDEKLRTATYINVRATRDILGLSKKMKHLESFVYVSTAYSNCVNENIREEFYKPPVTCEDLLKLVHTLNDDVLAELVPTLIGKWPNTYAFSKAVAESVVAAESRNLPVAVVRPSIVISTAKEPLVGWIDNVYGPTGALAGVGLGLIRTMYCNLDCLADLVPADYVINCTIAAAWDTATKRNEEIDSDAVDNVTKSTKKPSASIYNYVSSTQQPISWRDFMLYSERHAQPVASVLMIWYPFILIAPYRFLYTIYAWLLHQIPAYIVDFLAVCLGRQPVLVKAYQKIDKFIHVLSYFGTNQWNFNNDNTQALWKKLNTEDRKCYSFNMTDLSWDAYFHYYMRGGRMYILKDPLETIPEGQRKYRKLQVLHYAIVGLLIYGLYKVFSRLGSVVY